jgi:hypothetical protein
MSIAAAAVSWHFFESRINTYKRYFEYPRPRSLSVHKAQNIASFLATTPT